MRLPQHAVRKAIGKRMKATGQDEGPSKRRRQSPPRSPVRAMAPASPIRRPLGREQARAEGAAIPVDLTADTPPEGRQVEAPSVPAVAAAARQEAEPVGEAGPSAGRAGEERVPVVSVGESAAPIEVPPAPARGEAGEGGALEPIPSRPSLLNHGRRAERIMARTHEPELLAELHRQGASSFFRDVAISQLWLSNSVAAMREVLAQAETTLRQAQREATESRARAERAEEALEAARANEGNLERVKAQLEAAVENVVARDAQLDSLRQELGTAEEKGRELGEALSVEKGARLAAERRAIDAEQRVVGAEGSAVAAERRAETAERRAADAESKAGAAERSAAAAVDEYKASPAFVDELADASTDVYLLGFQDAKEKIGRLYGLTGLDGVLPDGAPSEPTPSEPADDRAGPADD